MALPHFPVSCRRAVVTAIAVAGLGSLAFADEAKQTPFVSSVTRNFQTWDADRNGELSKAEIDALFRDPKITGDDAAAVSALKLITRSSKIKLPALTVGYFNDYNAKVIGTIRAETSGDVVDQTTTTEGGGRDASGSQAGPTTKPIDSPARWDRYFVAGKKRLSQAGGRQWASSSFQLESMKQGALGDCFFVASLGSIAKRRPEQLHKLVVQQTDGSYKASFPDGKTFSFPKLTDSQIAISGTSGEGAFLAVFEQAFGKYRAQLRGKPLDTDGTDVLYTGGDSSNTLQQLTGRQTQRISFGKNLDVRAENAEKVLPEVRKLLVRNIESHMAITCGGVIGVKRTKDAKGTEVTTDKGRLPIVPPAILQNHVYVVTDYDAKADLVTIWNPHSNTFKPKGTPSMENGYVTEGGKFTLPLSEAYQFYGSFTFETDKPLEKKVDPGVS